MIACDARQDSVLPRFHDGVLDMSLDLSLYFVECGVGARPFNLNSKNSEVDNLTLQTHIKGPAGTHTRKSD